MSESERILGFLKEDGAETKVKIVDEEMISRGLYGNIFDATVDVQGHKRKFVIKKYVNRHKGIRHSSASLEPEECAKRAFENYNMLKREGMKVLNTFRIGEDGTSILMTPGISEEYDCASGNEYQEKYPINEIENFDEILETLFDAAILAAEKNIVFHHDAFFFTYKKQDTTTMDYFLGDLDNIKNQSGEEFKIKRLKYANICAVKIAIESFLSSTMRRNQAAYSKYVDRLNKFFEEFRRINPKI